MCASALLCHFTAYVQAARNERFIDGVDSTLPLECMTPISNIARSHQPRGNAYSSAAAIGTKQAKIYYAGRG